MNTNELNNKMDNNSSRKYVIKSLNNKSFLGSGQQLSSSQKRGSNPHAHSTASKTSSDQSRRRGGPRTPQGKQKSRRNALKHGIFSTIDLLEGELK